MDIEIICLTDKGYQMSHCIRNNNNIGWKCIYFLNRVGGKSTSAKICEMVYGGNSTITSQVLRNLTKKEIITRV